MTSQTIGTKTNSRPTAISAILAAVAAASFLVVEHYTLAELHPPFVYIAGVLAMALPFSAWCAWYRQWWPLGVYWSVTVAGGTAVIGTYTVDWALANRSDWLTGAGFLVAAMIGGLTLLAGLVAVLARQNRALRAEIALQRGLDDGVEKQQAG